MAIFGSLSTLQEQVGADARFNVAFAYLTEVFRAGSLVNLRVNQIPEGQSDRIDLDGGAFAIEQVYRSKPRSEGFFESHRRYIDVQVVVSGQELIEWQQIDQLVLKEDRTPEKDVLIYAMSDSTSVLYFGPGSAAIFFPVDGHMPQIAVQLQELVRKVVVKVPVN